MDAPLADLARRFRFNEKLLALETEGFTDADWEAPPGERGGNPAWWILAHVVRYRRMLLRKLEEGVGEEAWEANVSGGGKPLTTEGLPPPESLVAGFQALGERLAARLAALSPAEAAREGGSRFPDGGSTWEEGARFLYFHETYHLGQIGLIRRLRGHPGFV